MDGVDRIEVSGGAVEVRDLPATGGTADLAPLVLLHEGLGSVGLWRDVPAVLADRTGRRVVAYSRHGHGWSDPAHLPREADYMHHEAQVVLPEVIEALELVDPVLLGHSDGASIALIHAGTGAGTPTALVLLAPHVVVEEMSLAGIRAARDAYDEGGLRGRLARHHADVDATFRGWNDIWLSPAFRGWDIREACEGVTCPLLLVQGADDAYGTLAQLDMIQQRVTGSVSRLELPDCGHAPHLEHPEPTLDRIVTFLGEEA